MLFVNRLKTAAAAAQAKNDPAKADPPKAEPPKADTTEADPAEADPAKADPPKDDTTKADSPKDDTTKKADEIKVTGTFDCAYSTTENKVGECNIKISGGVGDVSEASAPTTSEEAPNGDKPTAMAVEEPLSPPAIDPKAPVPAPPPPAAAAAAAAPPPPAPPAPPAPSASSFVPPTAVELSSARASLKKPATLPPGLKPALTVAEQAAQKARERLANRGQPVSGGGKRSRRRVRKTKKAKKKRARKTKRVINVRRRTIRKRNN